MNHHFKIPSFKISQKEFAMLPYGRQIEHIRELHAFQEGARVGWLDTKRKTVAIALKEFMSLYKPSAYYFTERQSNVWHDDSIKIYYK